MNKLKPKKVKVLYSKKLQKFDERMKDTKQMKRYLVFIHGLDY